MWGYLLISKMKKEKEYQLDIEVLLENFER